MPLKPRTRVNRLRGADGDSFLLETPFTCSAEIAAALKALLDTGDSAAAAAIQDALSSNVLTVAGEHTITPARQNFVIVNMAVAGDFTVRMDSPTNGALVLFVIREDASDDMLRIGAVDGSLVDVYGGTGADGNWRVVLMAFDGANGEFVKVLDTGAVSPPSGGKFRFTAGGEFQLKNTTTGKYHEVWLEGADGAATLVWDENGEA